MASLPAAVAASSAAALPIASGRRHSVRPAGLRRAYHHRRAPLVGRGGSISRFQRVRRPLSRLRLVPTLCVPVPIIGTRNLLAMFSKGSSSRASHAKSSAEPSLCFTTTSVTRSLFTLE
jgi:hypothetical protein